MDTDCNTYYAVPQVFGSVAHASVDNKLTSSKKIFWSR